MRISGTEDVRDLGVAECMKGFALSRLGEYDAALESYVRGTPHFVMSLDALRLVATAANVVLLGGRTPLPVQDEDSTLDGLVTPAPWRVRVEGLWATRTVSSTIRPVVRLKPNA
jgi:hypothetical protein